MDMNNTFGPLIVGILFGFSINISSKLGDIIVLLDAIRELMIIGVAS